MRRVVIAACKRTPIGRNLGVFSEVKAPILGATAMAGTLKSINFPVNDVSVLIQLFIA